MADGRNVSVSNSSSLLVAISVGEPLAASGRSIITSRT